MIHSVVPTVKEFMHASASGKGMNSALRMLMSTRVMTPSLRQWVSPRRVKADQQLAEGEDNVLAELSKIYDGL